MTGTKNICGQIPADLHAKVREEIDREGSSTQKFLQQVIEEHFMRKGDMDMATARTLAVQVSEELFMRIKAVIAKKGCKQKDFLIAILLRAVEAEEAKWRQDEQEEEVQAEEPAAGETEAGEPVEESTDEPTEKILGEKDEADEQEGGPEELDKETEGDASEEDPMEEDARLDEKEIE